MRRVKGTTVLKRMTMVLAAAVLSVGVAAAADAPPAAKNPCADDVAKYCKDVKPGEGRIVRCLKEHDTELSTECRAKMTGSKKK